MGLFPESFTVLLLLYIAVIHIEIVYIVYIVKHIVGSI